MTLIRYIVVSATVMALILISSCKPAVKTPVEQGKTTEGGQPAASGQSEDVTLKTSDGFSIAGTFKQGIGRGPHQAVLLVHQLGKDMTTYAGFANSLANAGISSLAIDMRGHGKSTNNGSLDYNSFTDVQWVAAAADLAAGIQYLRSNPDVDKNRIGIVGASIGANLAVMVAADDMIKATEPPIACLLLLSPGVNYHSVQPLGRGHDLGHMPVMIISGTADSQSYGGSQALNNAARNSTLEPFNGRAHGTDLFAADPTLVDKEVEWIKANDKPYQREVEASPASGSSPAGSTNPPSQAPPSGGK